MNDIARTGGSQGRWPVSGAIFSGRRLIIAGFTLLGIILIASVAVSAWQSSVHGSKTAEMGSHAATASLLQETEEQAAIAAAVLQRYIAEGDVALIAEIQASATAAVESLTAAAAESGAADIGEIAVGGIGLAEGAGRIIALRQGGDVPGAVAAMEETAPLFEAFSLDLGAATERELGEVTALQSGAESADGLASLFLIVAVVSGSALGFAAVVLVTRSFIRQRGSKTASPV